MPSSMEFAMHWERPQGHGPKGQIERFTYLDNYKCSLEVVRQK